MNGSYYDKAIERQEQQKKIAQLVMTVSLKLIKFQKETTKSKLDSKINEFYLDDLTKSDKLMRKILEDIRNKQVGNDIVSTREVGQMLVDNLSRWRLQINETMILNLAAKIARDPAYAFETYIDRYLGAKQEIKRLAAEKQEALKFAQAQKITENKNKIDSQKKTTRYTYSSTYYAQEEKPKRKPVPYVGANIDESKKMVKTQIEKKLSDKNLETFTSEEQERIKKIYPEFSKGDGYHSVKTLENGILIDNFASNEKIKTSQMLEMGLLVLDVTCRDLVFGKNRMSESELYYQVGINKSFEKYQKSYEIYMKYYNSLTPEKKANVLEFIKSDKEYSSKLGEEIVSPEMLKEKINEVVKNHIISKSSSFYGNDISTYVSKTLHATKYMSIDEIANIYKRIKSKESGSLRYGSDEIKKERLEAIQTAFSNVLLLRIEEYSKEKNTANMTPGEKDRHSQKRAEKIAAICKDILGEKPMERHIIESTKDIQVDGKGMSLKESYEAKTIARSKVYGLSDVKKAMAKISGKWSRYLMLMEKEELSIGEQEELKGMFK